MTTLTSGKKALLTLLALAGTGWASSAKASDFSFSLNLGSARPVYYPRPVVVEPVKVETRRWIAPHYETRTERVLVSPEHKEQRWVEPVYETRIDRKGRKVDVLVREGYYTEVCVPARYEDRTVQVLIPGRYEEIVTAPGCGTPPIVSAPVVPQRPGWNRGDWNDRHDNDRDHDRDHDHGRGPDRDHDGRPDFRPTTGYVSAGVAVRR